MPKNKYANRPDISILIVEKSINPLDCEQAKHDISDAAYFLKGYGFTVNLTWTIGKYKFDDFNQFCESIILKLEGELKGASSSKDDFIRKIREKLWADRISEFRELSEILRKTPINSIDDLAHYNFLILHPDFDDCDKILPEIMKKYPSKPIIVPGGSIAAAHSESRSKEFYIKDVFKDAEFETYCVSEHHFTHTTLKLLEYLLDQRKNFCDIKKLQLTNI